MEISFLSVSRALLENETVLHRRVREYFANFDKDLNPSVPKQGGGRIILGAFS